MFRPLRHAASVAVILSALLMARPVNAAAMAIANASEECFLTAYRDPKGILTVGWGHTGPNVHPGMKITQDQADAWRAADMASAASFVDAHVHVSLTDNQFGALADFTYNVGVGSFLGSTLLRKLNKGQYASVPAELMRWNKAEQPDGTFKVLDGLTIRRKHEAALFMLPDTHTTRPVHVANVTSAPVAVVPSNATPQPPSLLERLRAWWHRDAQLPAATLTPS